MEVRFEKNIITGEEIEVIVKANRLTKIISSTLTIMILSLVLIGRIRCGF